jgi:putative ABC transport system permease protein
VGLGVATVVAAGSLLESALASVTDTQAALGDLGDLRVANGFAGVPDDLVEELRAVPGVSSAGAVVAATVSATLDGESASLVLIGVDLLGGDRAHHREFNASRLETRDPADFLTRLDAVALPRDFAKARALYLGSTFEVMLGAGPRSLYVAGLLPPTRASAALGGALAVMDLPVLQLLLEREGLVDAIDLRVGEHTTLPEVEARVRSAIDGRATVTRSGGEASEWRSLLFNVRLTLGLTGAVSLVVGAFVIYHAVSIAVSRRKPQLDLVRSLGAPRRWVFWLLSAEGLVLGVVGSVLGALLGIGLAWVVGSAFQSTVGALYSPLTASSFQVSEGYLAWGAILAVCVAWSASMAPARGALRMGSGLAAASPSRERWERARRLALFGVVLLGAGIGLALLERPGLEAETMINLVIIADALALVGVGLAAPALLLAISPVVKRGLRSPRLVLLRLAWQGITSDPARSAAVVTAILLGSAYVIYTLAAVGSLRSGVLRWLGTTQQADLIVTGGGSIGVFPSSPAIPGDLAELLEAVPDVVAVEPLRIVSQPHGDRWLTVASRRPEIFGVRQPVLLVEGDLEAGRAARSRGDGGIVSQHLAVKHGLTAGDAIELRTPAGPVRFSIAAVIDDYTGGDLGTVFVSPEVFRTRWRDRSATAYHLWLAADADAERVRDAVADALRLRCQCSILTRTELQERMTDVVDSIFYTAYGLELLAVLVMVVAITSFFTITLGERRHEIRLLRAVGATRSQLVRAFTLEALLIGSIGGVLGCVAGLAFSARFVRTAMEMGAGLVFRFEIPWAAVALVLAAAIIVSVLAALFTVRWATDHPTGGGPDV